MQGNIRNTRLKKKANSRTHQQDAVFKLVKTGKTKQCILGDKYIHANTIKKSKGKRKSGPPSPQRNVERE